MSDHFLNIKHRPEVDGLRALAVLPVILFHAGFSWFRGGYLGVDVFFVISGYLITSIILVEKTHNQFTLRNFYERRARRILPALVFVLLFTIPFAYFFLMPKELNDFSKSLISVLTFSSNFYFYSQRGGYFEPNLELSPLLHTWSLSIEEQYYFIYPFFLIFIYKFKRSIQIKSLLMLTLISLLASEIFIHHYKNATFYFLPTRMWELLVGALIALNIEHLRDRVRGFKLDQFLSLLGLGLLLAAFFMFDDSTPSPGLITFIPVLGVGFVIAFANEANIVGKILSHRVIVFIGLISYSLYLWHQPFFAFAKNIYDGPLSLFQIFTCLGLTFIFSCFTWKYIELPCRDKILMPFSRFKLIFIGCILLLLLAGLLGNLTKGLPHRIKVDKALSADLTMPMVTNGWCFYSVDSIRHLDIGPKGFDCKLGSLGSNRKAILFGDSYAAQYEPFWDAIGKFYQIEIHSITTNWCHPADNKDYPGDKGSRAFEQCLLNRQHFINTLNQYQIIILGARWGDVLSSNQFDGVVDLIEKIIDKNKIIILMPSPKQFDSNVLDIYLRKHHQGQIFDIGKVRSSNDLAALQANKLLENISNKSKNVIYISRDEIFAINGKTSDVTEAGIPFSLDGGHISIYGSKAAANYFLNSHESVRLISVLKSK